MKRKRASVKRKPKKAPVRGGAEVTVDPGYFSDRNEENDRFPSRAEIETREVLAQMSGQRLGLDEPVVNNETVGSAAASLARALSSSQKIPTSDKVPLQRERIGGKEPKSSHQNPVYNKKELDAAKSVFKKVMKMDAAVPFNAPVDPIALGIPDYFDIIDTPMDFGTICSKLENGLKYRNSEEVLKDVQLIWDNCCKYNKKGSYILELMKRVKSNFMKQWNAAGLYKEQQTVSNGHQCHNLQLFAESTMRHEEVDHVFPVGSTMSRPAYLQQNDWTLMNQMQHQQVPPCCSHSLRPQQVSYQDQCSFHPGQSQSGQHHHGLAPLHNHCTQMQSGDLANGKSCSQWINEASPSIVHSCQPSPSLLGHPKQTGCMHHSSSSQLPPSRFQAGINTQSAGHLHLPHREPTLTSNKCEHAFCSCRDADDGYQQRQYEMNSVHMQAYRPSVSCMPVQHPNQSTYHQLQSSHIEGGRNIDRAGNLRPPPPTESTANFTKRGTECPRPPITDDTNCQELNQINSTPDRSSSMINIEACQPIENACQNQPESSPSEHLHSTADNNTSKREILGKELVQCQEQSSPLMNIQKHQPKGNIRRTQTISPQPLSPPSTADENGKRKRISGARGLTLDNGFKGGRITIIANEQGQPVGTQAQKLVVFLGKLARNGHLLPLTYHGWRTMPSEIKENMWEKVQLKFIIDPMMKDWVLHNLGLRWKNWKSTLKRSHYDPHETDEERLADRDARVLPDQWAALITFWNSESAQMGPLKIMYVTSQKRSASNKANRMKQKYVHAAGRKSFATIREELRANLPDGKELSRSELFILTRTRKNGKPVNEASAQVIMQLRRCANGKGAPQDSNPHGDVLSEIIGADKKGRTRCIELGPSPSDLGWEEPTRAGSVETVSRKQTRPGSVEMAQKRTRVDSVEMVPEANVEIVEMKQKMSVLELTCAQMASQMAAMMSMMSTVQSSILDKNVPDRVAPTTDAASDPSVPQEVETRPRPKRQTRRRKARV